MTPKERRRIKELEAEVSALKAQLASSARDIRLKEDGGEAPEPGQNPTNRVDGLVVNAESDLYLRSCPPYVLQLLDELPVQIFLKKSELVDGLGRQYTYLNKTARAILKWEAATIPERYDSEAFQGGSQNPQWLEMISAETQAIEAGKKTTTKLQWTSPFGNAWRINEVIQIPVFSKSEDSDLPRSIGFCSIAQDIEFSQFQQTNQFFTRAVLHEYGNFCNAILSDITHSRAYPEEREGYLKQAENRALGAKAIAATLFDAVRYLGSTEMGSVSATINRVIGLTKFLPINLEVDAAEEALSVTYSQPRVALAVLLQLIANADKHTSPELRRNGRAWIGLSVRAPRDSSKPLKWVVSNLRKVLAGRLDFSDTSVSLGGVIMGNIVKQAYRVERAEEIIKFPENVGPDARVNIEFLTPRGIA